MAGDYTRYTFDPVKGFSGVLKQQGRVSLDSEANEFEEILDRRDRAEMYDTVGQAVYPLTTPNAFKIAVGAGGKLTIGQGRLYVDGIQAECFGDMTDPANADFDDPPSPHMNNLVGKSPLFYDQQPFFYTAPPFPALSPTAGATNVVYLDVWQREVTVFEDYALREIALNGPDTDTRMQTAWQVKVMDGTGALTCTTPLAAWDTLIAPSTARLTAVATPAPPAAGPCIISPAGGYTGLENRLYRVEIHKAGTVDGAVKAQFKWSRDNASLAARILSTQKITLTDWIVTVGSTGRDSWMRFEFGDHVEVLDDNVEFAMRESGTGGIMAKITSVNHATGEIHVDQDLTTFPIVAGRHPRIRRWDIASAVEPFVRNTSNGVPIALENGITITFGQAPTDTLHAGDFWVFAARTADGTIDTLNKQPPRNVLHHYAKLALVTSGPTPTVTADCRIPWPPPPGTGPPGTTREGCCTVVVHPGESIQAAIDSLSAAGGCVCLKAGTHPIAAPLTIIRPGVILHGESPGVRVTAAGLPVMLQIGGGPAPVTDVEVAMINFELSREAIDPIILLLLDCARVRILQCGVRYSEDVLLNAIGIAAFDVDEVEIGSNFVKGCYEGIHARSARGVRITENDLVGMLYERGPASFPFSQFGVVIEGLSQVVCRGNDIEDFLTGVLIAPRVREAVVADNDIRRRGLPAGIDSPQPPEKMLYGIDVQSDRCRVDGNRIDLAAQVYGGIRADGRHNEVSANRLFSSYPSAPGRGPIGVVAGTIELLVGKGDFTNIAHNHFTGSQIAVFASRSRGLHISGNTIAGVERQGFGIWIDYCLEALVSANQVHDVMLPLTVTNGQRNRVIDNVVVGGLVGAFVGREEALQFSGNLIENTPDFGIGVFGVAVSNRFSHNRVAHCGYAATAAALGIGVLEAPSDNVDITIESCEIFNTGVSADHTQSTTGVAIGIAASSVTTCELADNRIVYEGRNTLGPSFEHRAIWLVGGLFAASASAAGGPPAGRGGAMITGNVFEGPGFNHLVELPPIPFSAGSDLRFEKVIFANNRSQHATQPNGNPSQATVMLSGGHLIVSGNHVKAPRSVQSINLNGRPGTTLGNCTSGTIVNAGATTPSAPSWTNFNIQNII